MPGSDQSRAGLVGRDFDRPLLNRAGRDLDEAGPGISVQSQLTIALKFPPLFV
jgi:hypothetical protein